MPVVNDNNDFLLEVELAHSTRLQVSSNTWVKRKDQLKRWEASDTNREPTDRKRDGSRISFQEKCVFLAACSAGDLEEVESLLSRGADINTANVDGLTALHQVGVLGCIMGAGIILTISAG